MRKQTTFVAIGALRVKRERLGRSVACKNIPRTIQYDRGKAQGGGGTLNFSSYVGLGPASTLHPQKISGISSTPKNI